MRVLLYSVGMFGACVGMFGVCVGMFGACVAVQTSYLMNLVASSRSMSSFLTGLSMVARARQRRVSRPETRSVINNNYINNYTHSINN